MVWGLVKLQVQSLSRVVEGLGRVISAVKPFHQRSPVI